MFGVKEKLSRMIGIGRKLPKGLQPFEDTSSDVKAGEEALFLYQSGYLTIKGYSATWRAYTLGFRLEKAEAQLAAGANPHFSALFLPHCPRASPPRGLMFLLFGLLVSFYTTGNN